MTHQSRNSVIGPAGMLDFRPRNPWGRDWKPVRKMLPRGVPREDELYQVHVKTVAGKHIPVGPKLMKGQAEQFCTAIGIEIAMGREKQWSSPELQRVTHLKGA